ncbi:unnamed protein product [Periconia digitata]|uniref:Uncharacterized protein n=1 Tax=Periconia digitata TaxID=1303443 RepID=A0A9W4UNH8_9PLEO|nr:unnamed protein product [Periconia digitata]
MEWVCRSPPPLFFFFCVALVMFSRGVNMQLRVWYIRKETIVCIYGVRSTVDASVKHVCRACSCSSLLYGS